MKAEYIEVINELLNCQPYEINSALLSAQNRVRLYWTTIPIKPIVDRYLMLSSVVGPNDGMYTKKAFWHKEMTYSDYFGKSPCIIAHSAWKSRHKPVINGKPREFTFHELEKLQTLPKGYTDYVPERKRLGLIGNCWTASVIEHIFSGLLV